MSRLFEIPKYETIIDLDKVESVSKLHKLQNGEYHYTIKMVSGVEYELFDNDYWPKYRTPREDFLKLLAG